MLITQQMQVKALILLIIIVSQTQMNLILQVVQDLKVKLLILAIAMEKFQDINSVMGGGNGTLVPIYASSFQGKATSAATADSAEKTTSVADYGNTNASIKIGYSGAGLNTSNLKYIAGYTEDNGIKIKDVSKDVLKQWLGSTSATVDGTTVVFA